MSEGMTLLTVRELAERTGVPRWRWHEPLSSGRGPRALRIGRMWRISEAALREWIVTESARNEGSP